MNAILSIQDAYDQDQGIFSVLEKRRAVSSDSAEAGELSQGDLLRNQRFRDRSPKRDSNTAYKTATAEWKISSVLRLLYTPLIMYFFNSGM